MALRAGNYEEARWAIRFVAHLVRRSWRHMQSLTHLQQVKLSFHFHHRLAREHVKELPRTMVAVADFPSACWHVLLDHAQVVALEQMPAIAGVAPGIVFGIGDAGRAHGQSARACQRDLNSSSRKSAAAPGDTRAARLASGVRPAPV